MGGGNAMAAPSAALLGPCAVSTHGQDTAARPTSTDCTDSPGSKHWLTCTTRGRGQGQWPDHWVKGLEKAGCSARHLTQQRCGRVHAGHGTTQVVGRRERGEQGGHSTGRERLGRELKPRALPPRDTRLAVGRRRSAHTATGDESAPRETRASSAELAWTGSREEPAWCRRGPAARPPATRLLTRRARPSASCAPSVPPPHAGSAPVDGAGPSRPGP